MKIFTTEAQKRRERFEKSQKNPFCFICVNLCPSVDEILPSVVNLLQTNSAGRLRGVESLQETIDTRVSRIFPRP